MRTSCADHGRERKRCGYIGAPQCQRNRCAQPVRFEKFSLFSRAAAIEMCRGRGPPGNSRSATAAHRSDARSSVTPPIVPSMSRRSLTWVIARLAAHHVAQLGLARAALQSIHLAKSHLRGRMDPRVSSRLTLVGVVGHIRACAECLDRLDLHLAEFHDARAVGHRGRRQCPPRQHDALASQWMVEGHLAWAQRPAG